MDKYEYKVRSEEIERLIDVEKYAEAVNIADTIDWRRVKSITMLLRIAALYRVNRRNEDSRALLMLAYDRYPTNRSVVYSLCEVSIELDDVVAAIEYYKQFVKLAPRDNGVFTLRYRILEAQEASLEERIELLEELKKRDYQEEWAYELAYLYHRVGLATKCVEECDDMILWFGDGPYVRKAMELKMLHAPLTEVQQAKYDNLDGASDAGYADAGYADAGYSDGGYTENTYYNNEAGADEEYFDVSYPQTDGRKAGYSGSGHSDAGYSDAGYADAGYSDAGHLDGGYSDAGYADGGYGQTGYAEDAYTGEFYVDQTYDENGYPVEAYDNGYGGEGYSNEGYGDAYSNEGYGYPQAVAAVDMSQYNTINLQKVVAESMKELFPDEEETVSAKEVVSPLQTRPDSETQESEEQEASAEFHTQVYSMSGYETPEAAEPETASAEEKPVARSAAGKVAEMVTNVSEKSPEPDTGAIRKVFLPGRDARFMTDETESEALAEASEQTADAVQSPEKREEAMQSLSGEAEPFTPITGQMKLDDVLAEWERMKQENAQKHQEEIKQQVLTQTGKILAQFDNSLKSGILGELAQEEEKAERAVAGDSPEEEEILEVDLEQDEITDDEERYDVEYESESDEESDSAQPEDEEEYTAESDEEEEYDTDESEEEPYTAESGEADESDEEERYVTEDDESDTAESEDEEAYAAEAEAPEDETDSVAAQENDYTEPMSEIEQMVQDELGGRTAVLPKEKITAALKKAAEAAGGFDDADELYAEESDEEEASAGLDPEDEEMIAEMAKEDALKTQEIKMNTADLSTLSDKIVATTSKEAKGAKREEVRDFSPEEQKLFENFAVTKKIKKQIIFALEKMTLAAYTGNIIITGEAGLDTARLAKNLLREFRETDANFSGKMAIIAGEKLNTKNLKETFYKLGNGAIIIEKANGMSEEKLYEMTTLLNQETLGIIVILTDTKKEISLLLKKQAMIADYFNIRIDLIEMDNNALVAYAKNYALALEYSIDELGTLALYTRISNIQSGNHVVTKDEVRDIIDEAIWRSKKSRIKNFVDVLFSKRYDSEDMIVLKERDFM
ncbi:MAG: hypothetical protein NC337_06790 [Roseburia sp.]|nr:hypothetical protein [Roseburia sp.]